MFTDSKKLVSISINTAHQIYKQIKSTSENVIPIWPLRGPKALFLKNQPMDIQLDSSYLNNTFTGMCI